MGVRLLVGIRFVASLQLPSVRKNAPGPSENSQKQQTGAPKIIKISVERCQKYDIVILLTLECRRETSAWRTGFTAAQSARTGSGHAGASGFTSETSTTPSRSTSVTRSRESRSYRVALGHERQHTARGGSSPLLEAALLAQVKGELVKAGVMSPRSKLCWPTLTRSIGDGTPEQAAARNQRMHRDIPYGVSC